MAKVEGFWMESCNLEKIKAFKVATERHLRLNIAKWHHKCHNETQNGICDAIMYFNKGVEYEFY
jgi:hypothetical protein